MSVAASSVDREAAVSPGRMQGVLSGLAALVRRPNGAFGVSVAVGMVVLAIFAPQIAPYNPDAQNIPAAFQGPGTTHLLGTDELGRDLLSRLIYGTRIELSVALPAVAIAVLCGLVLGLMAGYFGGLIDSVLVIIMDTVQAFPAVILALALLFLLGPSLGNVRIVIAIAFVPNYARVSRASVYATKQNLYIESERALGASHRRVVLVHLLPKIIAPLLILIAMDTPSAIVTEAGLSFLGLGVQPPTPSWGVLLSDGFTNVYTSPWEIIFASLALMVATLGLTMLGEALRDVLDPRLAGSRGSERS